MSTVITSIDSGSPAEKAKIRVGEKLLRLNGHEIADVLDYRFFCYDPVVKAELEEEDGSCRTVKIRKEEGEDLGLNFDTYLMDEPRPCSNHCIFCFVDQMPPGMRDTLYFKDDDASVRSTSLYRRRSRSCGARCSATGTRTGASGICARSGKPASR